jgi:predicted nuclease with TOPRIM domain
MADRTEREQRQLICKLTESEVKKRGEEMAACELEIDDLKEQRRGLNGKIADLATQRNKLAQVIDDAAESRMVDCVWIEDIKQNCADLIRQDTGEKVDTRPLTADDLQEALDLDAGAPNAKHTRHAHA